MTKPSCLKRISRDMINFTHRRGAIGLLLILVDSVFQLIFLGLLWNQIVFKESAFAKGTELPRQSLFMSDMHSATFNFYICIYTILTIVPQIISALLFQTKNLTGSSYLMLKLVMMLLGAFNF